MEDYQFGRVRFLRGNNGGRYPFNHSLYLQGEKVRVILDPACSQEKLTRLRDEGVDQVWLSHWHEDHIHYINLFDGCALRMSERDFPPLSDINIFLDWYGLVSDKQRSYWVEVMERDFDFKPRREAMFLEDGEIIELGGLTAQALPTPGHTPGHLSFYIPEEELLFLGDYDLTSFGPWYGDVLSSIEDTIDSIRKLRSLPARRWVASHETGLFDVNPGPLWEAYEKTIYDREGRLLAFLDRPRTLADICSAWIIYKKPREPRAFYEFNEQVMIGKHLDYLIRRGNIVLEDNRYRRVTGEI